MANILKDADWIAIKGEYLAGVQSVRALGRVYGVSEGAIRKRAKTDLWGERGAANTKAEIVKAHFGGNPQNGSTNRKPKSLKTQKTQAAPNGTQSSDRAPLVEVEAHPIPVVAEYAKYAARDPEARSPDRRTPRTIARSTIEQAAAQDIEDMERGLDNARRSLDVVSDCLDFLEQSAEPIMAIRAIEAMLRTNQLAIDQIRRIRSLDAPAQKLDEMEAFKKLAEKGWIPEELLIAIHSEYVRVKPTIKATFRSHFQLPQGTSSEQCG